MVNIPEWSVPLIRTKDGQGLQMEKPWYQLFSGIVGSANGLLNATGAAGTMPGNFTGAAAADARHTNTAVKTWLAISASNVSGLAAVATAGTYASLTGTWSFVDSLSGLIEFPDNQDYIVGLSMPFAFTVNTMTTISASGTCTLVTKKNTTAITGLSNSVSTSQSVTTATAGNVFAVGDDVRLTVSSNASCERMAFCLKFTRTLP